MEKNGFTLVELLASITIISIILFAFLSFFIQDAKFANQNNQKLVAVNLLRTVHAEDLEVLKSKSPDEITNDQCSMPNPPQNTYCAIHSTKTVNNQTYQAWTFIQQEPAEVNLNLHPVISRVYYSDDNYTETYGYYRPPEEGDELE